MSWDFVGDVLWNAFWYGGRVVGLLVLLYVVVGGISSMFEGSPDGIDHHQTEQLRRLDREREERQGNRQS